MEQRRKPKNEGGKRPCVVRVDLSLSRDFSPTTAANETPDLGYLISFLWSSTRTSVNPQASPPLGRPPLSRIPYISIRPKE